MSSTRSPDPIIEEIHQTRRRTADRLGHNVEAILDDARKRQAAGGRPVWQKKTSLDTLPPGGAKAAQHR